MTEQQSTELKSAGTAAAEWWAQQIIDPSFRAVDSSSSREDHEGAGFAGLMHGMVADRFPVGTEQAKKFVAALAPVIDAQLRRLRWTSLGVDYGPDMELAKAATEAGVSLTRFPWKTHMSITADYVTASLGYRAPSRLIWSRPGWDRPACGTHHYDDEGYVRPENVVCTLPKFHDGEHGGWQSDADRCKHCGGTYVDHRAKGREYAGHSYEVAS